MQLRPAVLELVVADMAATLAFYRRLGLDLPADADGEAHVQCGFGGLELAFDTPDTIRSFDPAWAPPGPGGHRVALAFACDSPAEVDAAYAELTGSGAHGHLAPFDAFWGQRYAVVHDPDGNPVDLFAALPATTGDGDGGDGAAVETERGERSIVVRVEVAAPPQRVWALLTDPARHVALDGSGMVRGAVDPEPLHTVGQTFVMEMHQEQLGDYRTENTVLAVDADTRIAWTTARLGNAPAGVRWQWDLVPLPHGGTAVTHTYDWSQVTDPAVLARVSFPRVSAEQLAGTLTRLAATVA